MNNDDDEKKIDAYEAGKKTFLLDSVVNFRLEFFNLIDRIYVLPPAGKLTAVFISFAESRYPLKSTPITTTIIIWPPSWTARVNIETSFLALGHIIRVVFQGKDFCLPFSS